MTKWKIEKFDIIDRTDLQSGIWDNEPDLLTDYSDCGDRIEIIRIEGTGILCGYVYSEFHGILKGINQSDAILMGIRVHGGLTFSSDEKIGFDCGHSGDVIPKIGQIIERDTYKNIEFVMVQCCDLSRQMNKLKKELRIFQRNYNFINAR